VTAGESPALPAEANPGPPARLRVVPAEVWIRPGESADFRALVFDAKGQALGEKKAEWSLSGLTGEVDADGVFTAEGERSSHVGTMVARIGALEAKGRVRVLQDLPLEEDFESVEPGQRPPYQMAYLARWAVEDLAGNKVLAKGPSPIKIHRHITFLGHPDHSDYTIEGDLRGTKTGRRVPDIGLINSGYTMELLGGHQRLQIRSWQAGLRMMQQVEFTWEPDTWYRMKLSVSEVDGKGLIRGKVWPRGEDEPKSWTISAEDPLPIRSGAPGLSAYSPSTVYFDNIKVASN
jgi:hypothetical protein